MNSSRWYLSRRATKIAAEFGCRPDTLRERLVNALGRRYRKQVASEQLIKAVYGARSKHASHGSLMMIVKGAQSMIAKRKLPYVIKKERNDAGAITLGLYPAAKRLLRKRTTDHGPRANKAPDVPGLPVTQQRRSLRGKSLSRRSDTIPTHNSGKARIT